MKRILILLIMSFLLMVGCSSEEIPNSMFDNEGNLKEKYSEAMQQEWCAHNKDEEFAKKKCKDN